MQRICSNTSINSFPTQKSFQCGNPEDSLSNPYTITWLKKIRWKLDFMGWWYQIRLIWSNRFDMLEENGFRDSLIDTLKCNKGRKVLQHSRYGGTLSICRFESICRFKSIWLEIDRLKSIFCQYRYFTTITWLKYVENSIWWLDDSRSNWCDLIDLMCLEKSASETS